MRMKLNSVLAEIDNMNTKEYTYLQIDSIRQLFTNMHNYYYKNNSPRSYVTGKIVETINKKINELYQDDIQKALKAQEQQTYTLTTPSKPPPLSFSAAKPSEFVRERNFLKRKQKHRVQERG